MNLLNQSSPLTKMAYQLLNQSYPFFYKLKGITLSKNLERFEGEDNFDGKSTKYNIILENSSDPLHGISNDYSLALLVT